MGILDDAIREHLELKRQHGADRADVERLEKEAFGPATRPGDPEFDTGAEEAVSAEQPAAPAPEQPVPEPPAAAEPAAAPAEPPPEAAEDEGGFTDWFAEDETTVAPAAGAPSAAEPVAPSEPEPAPATPAERARIEHAELGDTADHPAPAQLGPEDEVEPVPHEASPSSEEPPPEAPESDIFDAGDLDVEDDLDERPSGAVPAPTTDHDLPPAPVQRPKDEEGEDLLEETPDFLQDAPEGEDLWFEQGPPKDFDFDEDDD